MIHRVLVGLAAAVVLFSGTSLRAEIWPVKPITIVVPFPAGGPIDATTRIVAHGLTAKLGQTVVVENVGGAAGSIAAGKVANASPDGYTLATGVFGTHVANAAVYKLSYDVQKDFEPVALISSNPILIVARSAVPADNLKELIAWLKANPGKATQGTSGVGSVGHLAGAMFQKETGTQYLFVPYRGLAPAMQGLMAGAVDLMFDTPATSLPQLKSGRIKAYAVMAKDRLEAAPEIPTVDELGFPGLHILTWTGFFAPRGTPQDVVKRLNAAVVEVLADPAAQKKLAEVGQTIYPPNQQSPEALAALQAADIKTWWPIIKAASINAARSN